MVVKFLVKLKQELELDSFWRQCLLIQPIYLKIFLFNHLVTNQKMEDYQISYPLAARKTEPASESI